MGRVVFNKWREREMEWQVKLEELIAIFAYDEIRRKDICEVIKN